MFIMFRGRPVPSIGWMTVLVLSLLTSICHAKVSYLSMHVGQVKVLDLPNVKRVAVGNPSVINYRPLDNGELILTASAPGVTTVEVWTAGDRRQRFSVTVSAQSRSRTLNSARSIGSAIPGVEIKSVDGSMVVYGEVAAADIPRVERLVGALPGSIDLTTPKDFSMRKMVLMDVRIIEVNRRAAEQLGVRWGQVAAGPAVGVYAPFQTNNVFGVFSPDQNNLSEDIIEAVGVADQSFYSYAGLATGLSSQIDLLAETGEASILAAPKLVTRSGEAASFNSGGEIPYQTIDEFGRPTIQFREYGIQLDIEPVIDANGNILTAVAAEVSSIDRANQVGDTPGLLTRNVESVINVQSEETIVLSGLASSDTSEQIIKVPFLGDIPYLGALFRSKEDIQEQTEIVVFVTPQEMSPASQKNRALINTGREMIAPVSEGRFNKALME